MKVLFCLFFILQTPLLAQSPFTAKSNLDVVSACLLNPELKSILLEEARKGLSIRILIDQSCLHSAESVADSFMTSFDLRISETRIAQNFVLQDNQTALFDPELFQPSSLGARFLLTDVQVVSTLLENFKNAWKSIDPDQNRSLLQKLQTSLENATLRTNSQAASTPGTSTPRRGFIGSSRSKVYYRADSPSAKEILPKNRIFFRSEEEAMESGRTRARNF